MAVRRGGGLFRIGSPYMSDLAKSGQEGEVLYFPPPRSPKVTVSSRTIGGNTTTGTLTTSGSAWTARGHIPRLGRMCAGTCR